MKLLWLLALVAGLSVYWNFKLKKENAKELAEVNKLKVKEKQLEHEIIFERDQRQSQINQETQNLNDLNFKLKNLNHDREALEDQLKGTNDVDLGGNNLSTSEWDIRHEKEVIADLDRQLKDVRIQEKEVSTQNKNVLNQDRASRAASEAALQSQIDYQNQTLIQIQDSLNQARADHSSAEVIRKLQGQVNQEREFINSLKTQKQNVSKQWTLISTEHNISQALPELQNSERDLTNRLQAENSNLNRLQQTYNSEKSVATQHNAQLGRLRAELQGKIREIQSVQGQIKEHSERLATLRAH